MKTETMLKQLAEDVAEIKEKLVKIEVTIEELDNNVHEVKPAYLEKLKRIEKGKFLSDEEFERALSV